MPIKIPNNLPAKETLNKEHIFVIDEDAAFKQDIRPLRILIMNLMPTKIVTETQLMRMLSNSPLQVEITLMHPATHVSKNTSSQHMKSFYKTFNDVKDSKFDGFIITGAPVELLSFEEVEYWDELCEVMEWSKSNVTTTLHICWGAQAGLYYHYGIKKHELEKKLFGIFLHRTCKKSVRLLRGFDDEFYVPQSRYTETKAEEIQNVPELEILAVSDVAGPCIIATHDRRQIYMSGHFEYDRRTLQTEYERDLEKGLNTDIPVNYFPNNDVTQKPFQQWRSHAYLLYSNWLNYYVYQATPYNIEEINKLFVPPKKGD